MSNRVTTREAAMMLGCTLTAAVYTLRTMNVAHERCGLSYLWEHTEVEALAARAKQNLERTK